MGGFNDGYVEQPGFRYEEGLPLRHDLVGIPCAVLNLPTRTPDGSAILLDAEHCMSLQKEAHKRVARVVEVPERWTDDAFLLVVQSSQQKVSIPCRVMKALYSSGVIVPCTSPSTPAASSTRPRTTTLPSPATLSSSTQPLASQSPSTAPRSRPSLVLPSSHPPSPSTSTTTSSTAWGGGAVARGPVTVHLAGLVKELEASRAEAAGLRARLPGLRQLEDKNGIIKTLQAKLAEAERERDEAREEARQRRVEGEHREAELRGTLQDKEELKLELGRQKRDMLELHERLERTVLGQQELMETQETEYTQDLEKLKREYEQAHVSALSALEEQHALAMANLQQAHDEEMMRQKDRYVAMESYSRSVELQLRQLEARDWVEVVPRPTTAPIDAAEGEGEDST